MDILLAKFEGILKQLKTKMAVFKSFPHEDRINHWDQTVTGLKPEEGPMFWTELLIAPIVVPVVFFLFAFTDITSFVPSEASLTVNIGVAFIFGFAIRRTIGLLDIIKKRFLPDPSPGSATPGG